MNAMGRDSGHEQDWYAILGIDPSAGPDAVRAAHRRLAKQWHPDTNPSPGAHDRMSELNRAREVLLDPAARAAFDRSRRVREQRETAQARVHSVAGPVRTVLIRTKVRAPRPPSRPEGPEGPQASGSLRPRRDAAGIYGAEPDLTRDWFAFLGVTPTANDGEVRAALRRAALALQVPGISAVEFARRSAELRAANASIGTAAARAAFQRAGSRQ